MLHPTYHIEIGSKTLEPSSADELVSVRISLATDTPADSCEAVLRTAEWTDDLEKDTPVSVALGYDDETTPVFSGTIDSLERGFGKIRTISLSQMLHLLNTRINTTYTGQTAGAIVRDLASRASIELEEVEDGLDLPTYYIDDSKNLYDHIHELAERSGFDVYMSPESKLIFREYNPERSNTFEYGKDIISIEADFHEPVIQSVKVYGESPASFKGSDTSHWLTKEEVSGEEGSGVQLQIFDAALRDKDTAQKAAEATLKKLSYAKIFSIILVGSPQVRLGDAVVVNNMPDEMLNGEFKVMGVEHILNKSEGFTSRIECGGRKENE